MNEESSKLLKWPVEITKMLSVTDKWDLCALHFLPLIYPELSNSTVNSYCFSKTKSYFKNKFFLNLCKNYLLSIIGVNFWA